MEQKAFEIEEALLRLLRSMYKEEYTDIKSVKVAWHNLVFLLISKVNTMVLRQKKECTLYDFVHMGMLSEAVIRLEEDHKEILGEEIDCLAEKIFQEDTDLSELRECILSTDLIISKTEIYVRKGKVARDATGSYYTPFQLANAVVHKLFSTRGRGIFLRQEADVLPRIADFSCGGGEFFRAVQEYLNENMNIPYEKSALYLWGTDVDPIALQITVCRLLSSAEVSDWDEIVTHFHLGNPLIYSEEEGDYDSKNIMFALNRIYAPEMGIDFSSSEFRTHFDIILGNPPWEKIRFEERKFFSCYSPSIASVSKKDDRQRLIVRLKDDWPELSQWSNEVSADYKKMCSKEYRHPHIKHSVSGELNTYALFTELAYEMLSVTGVCALIVKSTIATLPAHRELWLYLLKKGAVESLYIFENKNRIFHIDSRERFAVIIMTGEERLSFRFSAGLRKAEDLEKCVEVEVKENDIRAMNPFTCMLPNVTSTYDLGVLLNTHKRLRLFQDVYPDCHFGRLIHLTAHAAQIDMEKTEDNLPIYEGKFIEQYDGRYATFDGVSKEKRYAGKASARKTKNIHGEKPVPESRFFVKKELWARYKLQYSQPYSLCWRSLTSTTNRRTMIAMILPTCPTC